MDGELVIISGTGYMRASSTEARGRLVGPWPGTVVVAVEFPLQIPRSFAELRLSALQAIGKEPTG
jgi:hypothetical protein